MYRKKYLICIYAPVTEGETLIALCTSIREFSKFMSITYDHAVQTLHYLFTKQVTCIRLYGKLCSVEFVEE